MLILFGLILIMYAFKSMRNTPAFHQLSAVCFRAGVLHASLMSALLSADVTSCHMKAGHFMREHAISRETQTRSGYNPLLQDYSNFSMYLGGSMESVPALSPARHESS